MSFNYTNAQWRVDDTGIDHIGAIPEYGIAVDDVVRLRTAKTTLTGKTCYMWPIQLCMKPWVDLEAFLNAWLVAAIHTPGANLNMSMFVDTIAEIGEMVRCEAED
jgi:hypothetical protein